MNNVLVRFVAAAVLAVTWILIWVQILYASSLPGEGFSASVQLLLVVLLQYVVLGRPLASRRLPRRTFWLALLVGIGLLLALVAGPLVVGLPPLTVVTLHLGPVSLSSTVVFDLALFLVVSGSMLTALVSLPEPQP
jgi:multisubunit Na+/H+ antiporter MnhB subunit